MAAVGSGVSSRGSTNTRRAGHLLPLPCKSEPTAGSCVSPGSPRPCSKASRAAACYAADTKPTPEVEASAEKNRKTLLAISSAVGHDGRYGSRPAPSDRAGSLIHHRSASPSPCTRRGDGYREPHGGDEAPSSFTRRLEKRQGRLPARADLMKASSTLENIRLQATRHPSLLDTGGAVNDWRFPKATGMKDGIYDKNNSQTDTVSSCMPSGSNYSVISMKPSAMPRNISVQTTRHGSLLDRRVEGANQVPPRSIHKEKRQGRLPTSADFMKLSSTLENNSQTETVSSCMPSGSNHSAISMKPSATPQNIRVQTTRHGSLLDRRVEGGNQVPPRSIHKAAPARLMHQDCIVSSKCFEQSSSTVSDRSNSSDMHLEKDEATSSNSSGGIGSNWDWEDEYHMNTLGPGGGYGYPHPPPFYKCEVCRKRTAFYRIKCCLLVVCEHCSCECDPVEAYEDEILQDNKEELPEVKLQGSDLFLWQQCSFPAKLMLCLARRTGDHLKYYFAHIDDLMDPEVEIMSATVYDFRLQGRNASSLSVSDEFLTRNQLLVSR